MASGGGGRDGGGESAFCAMEDSALRPIAGGETRARAAGAAGLRGSLADACARRRVGPALCGGARARLFFSEEPSR